MLIASHVLILYLCLNNTTILNSGGTEVFLKLLNIGNLNGVIVTTRLLLNDGNLLTIASLLSLSRRSLIISGLLRRLLLFLLLSINFFKTLSFLFIVLIGAVSIVVNIVNIIVIIISLTLLLDTLSTIFQPQARKPLIGHVLVFCYFLDSKQHRVFRTIQQAVLVNTVPCSLNRYLKGGRVRNIAISNCLNY